MESSPEEGGQSILLLTLRMRLIIEGAREASPPPCDYFGRFLERADLILEEPVFSNRWCSNHIAYAKLNVFLLAISNYQ